MIIVMFLHVFGLVAALHVNVVRIGAAPSEKVFRHQTVKQTERL